MGVQHKCDHCGWAGDESAQLQHPRLGYKVCPDCWVEGYETCPRAIVWGPLIESVLAGEIEPAPRVRKCLIDWTDEEWAIAGRIERARAAHERADVRLPTTIDDASQLGFGWMREWPR